MTIEEAKRLKESGYPSSLGEDGSIPIPNGDGTNWISPGKNYEG